MFSKPLVFGTRRSARLSALFCLSLLASAAIPPAKAQPLTLEKVVKVTAGAVYRVVDPFVLVCAATGAPLTIIPLLHAPIGAVLDVKDCNKGAYGRYSVTVAPEEGATIEGRGASKVGGGIELDSGPAATFKLEGSGTPPAISGVSKVT